MADFDTSHVKNIVLLGHSGAGKTSIAECMLFESGIIPRRGSVRENNTVGDYHELEKERGNTIFSKLMHTRWRGYKINIIDTPGFSDFSGEVISALRVADNCVMVLNAATGVEIGTQQLFDYVEDFKIPMVIVVNKIDEDYSNFDAALQSAKDNFGSKVVPLQYPVQEGAGFHEIIDVLRMTMYRFSGTGGKPEKLPIPENEWEKADEFHKELVEAVAGNDEVLMEKYFDKGELEEEELTEGLKKSIINHDIFPLFCMSAERNMGSGRLMGFIDMVCPGADELTKSKYNDKEVISPDGAPCMYVFKTTLEPHIGEMAFFKVFSGTVKQGTELVNATNGTIEKPGQLFLLEGNKRIPVQELVTGDIGVAIKLRNTRMNDTLHDKNHPCIIEPVEFPEPQFRMAILTTKKEDEDKLSEALQGIKNEEPTMRVEYSPELKQTIIHCMGDMHLSVIKWKLEHNYRIEAKFVIPRIPYRETIRKPAEAQYRHKKQSGGAGQFAEVFMKIEPWEEGMADPKGLTVRGKEEFDLEWGGKLVFLNCIVGGAIDTRFLPSILKGVKEKMQEGPLTGSYVRDVRVAVFDGKMHPVDSNDISFKIAGMKAFKEAFNNADPQVLEPVYKIAVTCPDDLTGNVIGDLQTRRAILEGMDARGNFTIIQAKIPLAEMQDYSSSLRSLTQGRAKYHMSFSEYLPVSPDLQKKLMAGYKQMTVDDGQIIEN